MEKLVKFGGVIYHPFCKFLDTPVMNPTNRRCIHRAWADLEGGFAALPPPTILI